MAAPIAYLRQIGQDDLADSVERIVAERTAQHYLNLLEELRAEQVSA